MASDGAPMYFISLCESYHVYGEEIIQYSIIYRVQVVSRFNGWARHSPTYCTTPKMPVVTLTAMSAVRRDFIACL